MKMEYWALEWSASAKLAPKEAGLRIVLHMWLMSSDAEHVALQDHATRYL